MGAVSCLYYVYGMKVILHADRVGVGERPTGQVEVLEGTGGWASTGGLRTAEGAKPVAVSSVLHFESDPQTRHHQTWERNGDVSSWITKKSRPELEGEQCRRQQCGPWACFLPLFSRAVQTLSVWLLSQSQ